MKAPRWLIVLIGFVLVAGIPVHAEQAGTEESELDPPILLPIVLNIVPGLGLGSFVQRDGIGGLIGLGGELTGVALIGAGYIFTAAGAVTAFADEGAFLKTGILMFVGGLATYAGTKIFEIIRPIVFAIRRR